MAWRQTRAPLTPRHVGHPKRCAPPEKDRPDGRRHGQRARLPSLGIDRHLDVEQERSGRNDRSGQYSGQWLLPDHDTIRGNQLRWLEAALDEGLPLETFLIA